MTLYFAIQAVRAYLNGQNMVTNIAIIKENIVEVQDEINFTKYYEKPFLETDWAPFYLWHEHGTLYAWERVVRLKSRKPTQKVVVDEAASSPDDILSMQQEEDDFIKITSPQESRHYFINDKLTALKEIWLLE